MNTNIVTIKADNKLLEKIIGYYRPYIIADDGEYVLFRAQKDKVIVTAYRNTKNKGTKITFAGRGGLIEAKKWDTTLTLIEDDEQDEPIGWVNVDDQIGSDEVGTGDFFGPICVCAAFVRKEDVTYLKKIGVTDSKKLSDDFILTITPQLLKKFSYSQVSLNNEKYNELNKQKINMNEMKARLHNRVLLNLMKKHSNVQNFYVDKFVSETKFFAYASCDEQVKRKIVFKTKGESRFPSVALASVIARYSFLKKMEAMGQNYGTKFPFGASAKVDVFTQSFIDRFGKEEMNKVAKINFANYKRI